MPYFARSAVWQSCDKPGVNDLDRHSDKHRRAVSNWLPCITDTVTQQQPLIPLDRRAVPASWLSLTTSSSKLSITLTAGVSKWHFERRLFAWV
jgi:hypothetical protein